MFLFLKKKADPDEPAPQETAAPEARSIPFSEFIPYYCHYNPHTLLTKNGELLQTIKIAKNMKGLDYEGAGSEDVSARETIRRAVVEAIPNDHFSVWFHTMRKRKSIRVGAKYTDNFATYVHEQWQRKHRWKYQYYNEIYVTILHEGQGSDLMDKEALNRIMIPVHNRQYRREYLENACAALDQVTAIMLAVLREHYNAELLGVTERFPPALPGKPQPPPIFCSEPMEFLGTLINLREEPHALPEADISTVLPGRSLAFGFNALETRNAAGKRRFAAILSLKQYRELPLETADRMLQAPMEFIISQSMRFTSHKEALKQYKEQKEYFEISGDQYAIKASGIEDMMQSNQKRPQDFVEHQTTIMVIIDEFKQLNTEVARMQEAFPELGLVTIREDIRLEENFWAQLPGNFEFIRRRTPLNTIRVAGFCRLNRFPDGQDSGNHWGDAVTLIPTMVNSPYFFNFHHQNNGHSVLFDFNSYHDHASNIMLNFLLCELRKYNGKLTIFDGGRSSRLLVNKLGGDYHLFPTLDDPKGQITVKLNPFLLEDNPRNKAFLLAWCNYIISPDIKLAEPQRELLQGAIDELYTKPLQERALSNLATLLAQKDKELGGALITWQAQNGLLGLVDGPAETLEMDRQILGFDMHDGLRQSTSIIPVFSYLLHRVITNIDGKPSVIVLHDAWDMLENSFFAPRLESLLDMLRKNNVMVICTARHPSDCANTHILNTLMQSCATRLYMPDEINLDYVTQNIGLDAYDSRMMRQMYRKKGDFLLKQNGESIALQINLDGIDDVYAIFANDSKSLLAQADKLK